MRLALSIYVFLSKNKVIVVKPLITFIYLYSLFMSHARLYRPSIMKGLLIVVYSWPCLNYFSPMLLFSPFKCRSLYISLGRNGKRQLKIRLYYYEGQKKWRYLCLKWWIGVDMNILIFWICWDSWISSTAIIILTIIETLSSTFFWSTTCWVVSCFWSYTVEISPRVACISIEFERSRHLSPNVISCLIKLKLTVIFQSH